LVVAPHFLAAGTQFSWICLVHFSRSAGELYLRRQRTIESQSYYIWNGFEWPMRTCTRGMQFTG
jgi:hypothetical protein